MLKDDNSRYIYINSLFIFLYLLKKFKIYMFLSWDMFKIISQTQFAGFSKQKYLIKNQWKNINITKADRQGG